jgi:hypothetical protein
MAVPPSPYFIDICDKKNNGFTSYLTDNRYICSHIDKK